MAKGKNYFDDLVAFKRATESRIQHMEAMRVPDGSTLESLSQYIRRLRLLQGCQKKLEQLIPEFRPEQPGLPMD